MKTRTLSPINTRITFFRVLFFVFLCVNVEGQSTENPDLKLLKEDEASILTSLLHIVDKKFDTLSSRMSALETAVNGLQFYNLRQFKIINNNLHGVNTFIQGVHGKITQFDISSRAVKIAVDILDQDITEFTEFNKQLMEDMSKEMAAIDKSVHEKTRQIKDIVEIVEENLLEKIAMAHTSTTPSSNIPASLVDSPFKCDVNTTALQRQIDARFSEMRSFAHRELVQLHNVSRSVSKIANVIQNKQLVPQNLKRETNSINPLPQQEIKPGESDKKIDQKTECSILENERLFKALSNMTANIVQSVSYFRHTGGLFEELITNTDSMAVEQGKIRQEIAGLRSNIHNQNFTEFPNGVEELLEVTSKSPPSISKPNMIVKSQKDSPIIDRMCSLSLKELNNIMAASKNESQLLTVVTQLVLNTSVSLSNTLIGLQDELNRLQDMKVNQPQVPRERHILDTSKILRDLVNQTKQTYKMVRIIASNTGWMPHTFQRVGSVGEQINKSLEITQNLYGDFSNIFDLKPHSERESNKAQQEIESSLNRRAQTAHGEHYVREGNISLSLPSSPLLDLIFNTNKELKRIMPALTRLLAEPEPLFSLVNGGKANEGRLEVYYHGQWATMCGANLNNEEASFICRSLAYSGGVASPRGSYGPGTGAFRSFNKTCIRSQRCPVITESRDLARCNHAEDLAIVCDHMVRVVDNDGYISRSRGRLQLYHQGKWRPVCSRGWKESEVRTACRQLGYSGGRLFNGGEVNRGSENLFVSNILCEKESDILHTCDNKNWMMSKCSGYLPVALVCQ